MWRSIRLKILGPSDSSITWEDLGYLLHGLSFKVCKISNFCLTHQLLRALKLETENLNPRGHLYCYPRLAEEYPEVPSGILCAVEGRARKVFKSNAAAILRSEISQPSFRKDSSIPIPTAGYSLVQEGTDTFATEVQLLSRQGARQQKLPGRIRLRLANNWRDKRAADILRQLAEGTLKRGVASISRSKGNWYMSIPYLTEAAHREADFSPGLVMGIAFGTHCALSYAFNQSLKRGELKGEEALAHQEKYLARAQHIREQYKWSGRKGHGRERALEPLRQLYEKERNYLSLVNDRYARWFVEIAKKNRCGRIHLETFGGTGQAKPNILLARWPRDDLRQKIRDKAEALGIRVLECTDETIRKRCSRCGAEQEETTGKRTFACTACGYGKKEQGTGSGFASVDYNAARNLAVLEI